MKLCVVNVNNCIDFTQYGPFLFEEIKNRDCVVCHSIGNTAELDRVYSDLLAEYNRNAFGEKRIKLLFIIPRNMESPKVCDYELYNEINIHYHITSKLDIFSEISTIYLDECSETVQGATHQLTQRVREDKYTNDEALGEYFPVFEGPVTEEAKLAEAVAEIENPVFREFYTYVLSKMPEDVGDAFRTELMNAFSSYCAQCLSKIKKPIYQLVKRFDVADSIRKRLKIIYFIKRMVADERVTVGEFESYLPDYKQIGTEIAAYKKRLSVWLSGKELLESKEVTEIRMFLSLKNASAFADKLQDAVSEHLAAFGGVELSGERVVETIFEKFTLVAETADEHLKEFSQDAVDAYFDEHNYYKGSISEIDPDKLTRSYERELTKNLNNYSDASLPSEYEKKRLYAFLQDGRRAIEELFACRHKYFFGLFMSTLLFAGVSLVALYFLAQHSVLIKEHSFWVFGAYSAGIIALFFGAYASVAIRYKREIGKIIRKCLAEVVAFLERYKTLAREFEEKLNLMAEIFCLREFLAKRDDAEEEFRTRKRQVEWHRIKTTDILKNMSHFNDFIKDAEAVCESKELTPAEYQHDAEHTPFYQVKLF